jgi:hypothetical protein
LARLRIVGPALAAQVERSLSHLWLREEPSGSAELSIDLWDESATGVHCAGCEVRQGQDVGHQVSASSDARYVTYHVVQTKSAVDRAERRIVGWVGSATEVTHYERGRPLLPPLLRWLMDRGIQALHAGLVARDGRGVLLAGPSGTGKSTTALACASAGFAYLADDCVGLEAADGVYVGHSLFTSANLEPTHLENRLPSLSSHGIRGRLHREDKSLLLVSDIAPGGLARAVRVVAVALPRVRPDTRTSLRPATRVEALLRLAPSSTYMFAHARGARATFDTLARMIEAVPSYWLDLGPDIDQIAPKVDEILRRAAGR